ncbi:ribonucleotide monophosphatase NagD [Roseomonas sp. TAS13]|uniref:TIGR01459 family HAD-type hydrolase n=1 Tax=Roseomonas sp. TAS13 TaxID=1926319 RepID=UPI0009682316|nr:TIGR01459 family HAD-type hydrolase [Roseomonas sp. TAS13]GAV34745.1 ribonucleotide monophosphatase NagD [Roseomonas sp. TAS13]
MKIFEGITPLAERYDGFVVDLWGVVHDGVQAYPGVTDALAQLQAAGKRVVFLSNAPRRSWVVEELLARLGVPRSLYVDAVTSGEVAWEMLRDRTDPWFAKLGRRAYHLGPATDLSVIETLDLTLAERPDGADFLLNTGPDPQLGPHALEPYDAVLRACAEKGLPMVCVNPDREVVVGGRILLCAGAFTDRYRLLGVTDIFEVGKPDPTVYGPVLRRLAVPKEKVLAVGDGPRTDLAGAKAAGLDCVWVLNGLSAALAPDQLDTIAAAEKVFPLAALRAFRP